MHMAHRGPRLFLVLGDQLHPDPHPLLSLAQQGDYVLMVEAPEEATHVWSHKARITLFFSAMRHFAERWQTRCDLTYLRIGAHKFKTLGAAVDAFVSQHPDIDCIGMLEAGDARVSSALAACGKQIGRPIDVYPDPHFLCSLEDFEHWANRGAQQGKAAQSLRMEFFYRWMRRAVRTMTPCSSGLTRSKIARKRRRSSSGNRFEMPYVRESGIKTTNRPGNETS